MFGGDDRELVRLKKRLFSGKLHTAQHADPKVDEVGEGLAWVVGLEENRWTFDFAPDLADHVSKFSNPDEDWYVGPWVLERLSDVFDPLDYNDGPRLALNYRLYYNTVQVGRVWLRPRANLSEKPRSSIGCLSIHVEMNGAALLPHGEVEGFLSLLTGLFPLTEEGDRNPDRLLSVTRSLQAVLWEANRVGALEAALDFVYFGAVQLDNR